MYIISLKAGFVFPPLCLWSDVPNAYVKLIEVEKNLDPLSFTAEKNTIMYLYSTKYELFTWLTTVASEEQCYLSY